MSKKILVTGGAGFIGSALVRRIIGHTPHHVLVLDKLTYAGNLDSLQEVAGNPRFGFKQGDIGDTEKVRSLLETFRPDIIINLAAETHVDRSIDGPAAFIQTNIVGTFNFLQEALSYWRTLDQTAKQSFRFHHVSTDEVFGSLGPAGYFSEQSSYQPNSPYSASKAASDHLVTAWSHTYGLPVLLTNCSNNYGPFQFPEKLIPLTILNALEGKPLPVYGAGDNVRDWLHVDDHARALCDVALRAALGSVYVIGGSQERMNIDVVRQVCAILDQLAPSATIGPREKLITFVTDRPGHDQRYAIDPAAIRRELGWEPAETFDTGLVKTVQWYLDNREWWERVRSGVYRGQRLGLADNTA